MDIRKEVASLSREEFLQFVTAIYQHGAADEFDFITNDRHAYTDGEEQEYMAEIAYAALHPSSMLDKIFDGNI